MIPLPGDREGASKTSTRHCLPNSYASALFTVSAKPEESLIFGGSAALNSWAPMPFNERCLIELVNENDLPIAEYWHPFQG
jgi:hypothetical protein